MAKTDTYYAAIQSGSSHEDAELHTDADCGALDGAARPLSGSVVGPETHTVHDCGSFQATDEADAGAGEAEGAEHDGVEVCDAVKADGEVCGREEPCPYHSD